MNNEIHKKIWEIKNKVKEQQFMIISKEYGEQDLFEFDNDLKYAQFLCNPYEDDVWGIINALYAIDDITDIEIHLTDDIEEGYHSVEVKWR